VYYNFTLTIPANTAATDREEKRVKLTHGVITRVEVSFPRGCAGLAHLQIYENGHQVWPTNPDGDFASDDYTIPIDEYHEFFRAPYQLRLSGWNLR